MNGFNYDYAKTMMMKMFLSRPSEYGSEVLINFAQALNLIKRVDNITQHIPKIVYLVGWQNCGHDDRYPDIFEVNKYLKSQNDETAYQSLIRLIKEAKKYNTVVSLHINFADAYDDAEMFGELKNINALIRNKDGKTVPIEKYNDKDCYKVSYKEYWESGLFKRYFDKFIDFMPVIKEQKTIHVDNFQCYFNYKPDIHVNEMQEYRNKMINYVSSFGIDVTSEGVYRECEAGEDNFNCKVPKEIMLSSPLATLGRIPAVWWLSPYGDDDFLKNPPEKLCGGIPGDEYYEVFYGSTHGEDVWLKEGCADGKWEQTFIDKFSREVIPYRYLNTKKLVEIKTSDDGFKTAYFDDGTVSCGKTAAITSGEKTLKCGSNVSMPVVFMKDTFLFYSRDSVILEADTQSELSKAALYKVTADGNEFVGKKDITNGKLKVKLNPNECIIAKLK